MECVVVQDLFLNETANYAHVFLPGCTFLEKDGTFTNAERRIQRVRKVMAPKNGYGDWEITMLLANAMGYAMHYKHPSEIMDEIARRDAELRECLLQACSTRSARCSGPATTRRRMARRSCTSSSFARGKGKFVLTEYIPTDEKTGPRFPLLLTTGRILSAI